MAKKLPFWIIPAHWGLSGKAKELAKINYQYEGYEADIRSAPHIYLTDYEIDKALVEIEKKYNKLSELEFELKVLDVDLKHKRINESTRNRKSVDARYKFHEINEREYDAEIIELMEEGDDKKLAAVEFAFKYHDITEHEYNKELYTLRKEPWADFNIEFEQETNEVAFTFDYNEYFWKQLKSEGHPGNDEEEIIENFIRDWGRKLVDEEYTDDPDVNLTRMTDELPENIKFYK